LIGFLVTVKNTFLQNLDSSGFYIEVGF